MSQRDPLIGRTLDERYRLVAAIGRGTLAAVFQAVDLTNHSRVAVKIMHPQLASEPKQRQRFLREIDAVSRAASPNVVQILAHGTTPDDLLYFVMEWVEGPTLAQWLANEGARSLLESVDIGAQICSALVTAHASGIVHRDLNPNNVLVSMSSGRWEAKVTDFGFARLAERANESLTAAGQRVGSHTTMAPEYVRDLAFDERADLYALGVLLYALLTGDPPFVGPSMKVLQAHVSEPPIPPAQRSAGVPPWLDELVISLLAKSPSARPPSAEFVYERLQSALPELALADSSERESLGYRTPTDHAAPRGAAASTMPQDEVRLPHSLAPAPQRQAHPLPATWSLVLLGAALTALAFSVGFALVRAVQGAG